MGDVPSGLDVEVLWGFGELDLNLCEFGEVWGFGLEFRGFFV